VIVAVPAVGVMEMTVDQVVRVIAVGDRRVTAALGVDMAGGVSGARMSRRAAGRVRRVDRDRAFIDVVAVHHVQMTVVEVVDVAAVLDGEVPAVGTVNMAVAGVRGVRHRKLPSMYCRSLPIDT
jgi:hypothetical protein